MSIQIKTDFSNQVGKIKPMNGVGQPPLLGIDTSKFSYLTQANIPYSRLHDVGGWFGGNMFVDIPNIFRDFSADVDDENSYDFTFTDILIKGLADAKCEPIYRLGITIENYFYVKRYRSFPPEDNLKWAKICEHIIRHYNYGWANGFHYNITYWEIWNEPDSDEDIETNNAMWYGTKEQYFDLYRVTAKHLKNCFGDEIKVGGYASLGFEIVTHKKEDVERWISKRPELKVSIDRQRYFKNFFEDFLEMCKSENLPFDFFSWHSYLAIEKNIIMQKYVEETLEKFGFSDVDIMLDEWYPLPTLEKRGTALANAECVSNMINMQNTRMTLMCFYDAAIAVNMYGGLFNPMYHTPLLTYYGFKAFGELLRLKNQAETKLESDTLCALGATDGKEKNALLVSNNGDEAQIEIADGFDRVYVMDDENMFVENSFNDKICTIKSNQVLMFTNYEIDSSL